MTSIEHNCGLLSSACRALVVIFCSHLGGDKVRLGHLQLELVINAPHNSSSRYSLQTSSDRHLPTPNWDFSHCNNIRRTSFVCLLILCAPSSNSITEMRALVVYLGVITHAEREND